ncbi:hypothetical protein [Phaeovulum sp. NW3]|uniref:hypothetical protein n=1 Tax=Phaeovulum sp. NW3 TaxID=2934933 RepID=UPI0020204E7B|nr:hypothetical protein [Phaeovulum sp. NW3]MCL7466725.1 hypothetical protein [Phaeovulum sp. NW3]
MKHLFSLACIAGLAVTGPARADPSPFCGKTGGSDWSEVVEAFVGAWRIEHQSGYARMGTMVLPFPGDGEVETLTVALRGDILEATHPQAQAPLVLRLADEPRWVVERSDPYVPAPVLSPDDVGLMMGCDQMKLPRLVGTSTAVVDGVRMDFTYRMMAIDWSNLYGIMEMTATVQGNPVLARRTVWMRGVGQ